MKINLPNSIYSYEDYKELISDIKKYSQWFMQYTIKNKVVATSMVSAEAPTISEMAIQLIKSVAKDQALSQKLLTDLITNLEELSPRLPRMTITLSAVPTKNIKKSMVDWFRKNVDPAILIDFSYNSTLLGGMVVIYNSHIYDWSFRRQILANTRKFPEILRNV